MEDMIEDNERELISIIVPVYNAEKFLKQCLDSILGQTYSNYEVILINDGSKDESERICKDYVNQDKRYHLFNQNNRGVSAARNSGLNNIKGKYVTFVDADDTIDSQYLESLYRNLKKVDADISMCAWSCKRNDKRRNVDIEVWNKKHTLLNMFKSGKIDGSVCSKLYRAECIKGLEFNEKLRIGEDQIFAVQAISRVNTVVFQNTPLYTYYIRNTSAMNSKLDSRYWDIIYRAEWFKSFARSNMPELVGLFRKEEINIYVTMVIRDMKGRTNDSKEIVEYIWPRIKEAKCKEFFGYSTFYQFARFIMIKYFYRFASLIVQIKNRQ